MDKIIIENDFGVPFEWDLISKGVIANKKYGIYTNFVEKNGQFELLVRDLNDISSKLGPLEEKIILDAFFLELSNYKLMES